MVNIQSKLSHLLALYYTCVSIFVYYCAIYLRSTSICAIKQHMDILNISGYPSNLSSHLSSQIEVSLVQNVHRLCYCTVTVDFVVVDKRFYTPPSKYITKRTVPGKELTQITSQTIQCTQTNCCVISSYVTKMMHLTSPHKNSLRSEKAQSVN